PIWGWTLTRLREKLIKIGAKLVAHAKYVTFQLAAVAVPRPHTWGVPCTRGRHPANANDTGRPMVGGSSRHFSFSGGRSMSRTLASGYGLVALALLTAGCEQAKTKTSQAGEVARKAAGEAKEAAREAVAAAGEAGAAAKAAILKGIEDGLP